ncbi:hypothetical protein CTM45_07355 [Prevotella intermedia]|uniref:Uncharacterized protein n=1 Tax=Prevotella intermedia TaxID=28131 RepID=A0A2D3LJA8_PREIN|nr:hypothetical protein CTM46_03730 [Prevotella intermedia]PJI23114.1 hypothetical protein CTM45_07355 [Prevotella intermedia]
MNCYRIYSFFIHKLSNAAKVINKGHLRGFSLPNVHYAELSHILYSPCFFLDVRKVINHALTTPMQIQYTGPTNNAATA